MLATVAWSFPFAMLLQRSLGFPDKRTFVTFVFHHADHYTYYQVDLLICFSAGCCWSCGCFVNIRWPGLVMIFAVMHSPVGASGSGCFPATAFEGSAGASS